MQGYYLANIAIKVAGAGGTFETLLTKARFEEAKFQELGRSKPDHSRGQNFRINAAVGRQFSSTNDGNATPNICCFKFGSMGHIASNWLMKGRRSRED